MHYVSVEEADAYFAARLDSDNWTSATPTRKLQAISFATQALEKESWVGVIKDRDQPLAWPRNGMFFDPRAGYSIALGSEIPSRIKDACCETALHLLSNPGLLSGESTADELTVGPITLKGLRDVARMPPVIYDSIRPFLRVGGGSSRGSPWWRAN